MNPIISQLWCGPPRSTCSFLATANGGQVRIPALGPVILPPWGRIYHTGLYELNGRFVYTGRGLGMVELPLRFNCPPELTEITLAA
jgi:predicted MPP superfamily phosphohydrolase